MVFLLVVGLFLLVVFFEVSGSARASHPQGLALSLMILRTSTLFSFLTAITLAGSGIETVSVRPGVIEKSAEESTLFTLSLPVTRVWLFVVRTFTGVIETLALLTLFTVAAWLLAPPLVLNAYGALRFFALIVPCSLTVYAVSACLSTFCDESWRFRISSLAIAMFHVLASLGKVPVPFDISRTVVVTSPLTMYQIPWLTLVIACVLAFLFFGAALQVIQRRDY